MTKGAEFIPTGLDRFLRVTQATARRYCGRVPEVGREILGHVPELGGDCWFGWTIHDGEQVLWVRPCIGGRALNIEKLAELLRRAAEAIADSRDGDEPMSSIERELHRAACALLGEEVPELYKAWYTERPDEWAGGELLTRRGAAAVRAIWLGATYGMVQSHGTVVGQRFERLRVILRETFPEQCGPGVT